MSVNDILGWVLVYIWSFTAIGMLIYAARTESNGGKKK